MSSNPGLSIEAHELVAPDPFGAYVALRRAYGDRGAFLLESLAGPEADRRSAALGFGPLLTVAVRGKEIVVDGYAVLAGEVSAKLESRGALRADSGLQLTSRCTIFDVPRVVEQVLAVPGLDAESFGYGYLAFYGYDVVQHVEELPRTIEAGPDAPPDLVVAVYQGIILFDLVSGTARLALATGHGLPEVDVKTIASTVLEPLVARDVSVIPTARSVTDSTTEAAFHEAVHKALGHIAIGDIYQVQLGHEITVESEVDELVVYQRLRERNPSPYMAIAPVGDLTMISASPELFLRIQGDRMAMRPIAGTTARTGDAESDALRKEALRSDEKEVAEHTMLVDLCRNDLSRVAQVDSVVVDELMVVEDYSHVCHLVSNVKARLVDGPDAQDVIAATFPAGTMTGAPKIRAMEIIEDTEDRRRGFYAGAFGLIGLGGYVNMGLCIRTLFRTGDVYRTRASAGIVSDSTPAGEWRETLTKLNAAVWAVTDRELA